MEYYAISDCGSVIDLGCHDSQDDAYDHAQRGPWEVLPYTVFTEDEIMAIGNQINVRFAVDKIYPVFAPKETQAEKRVHDTIDKLDASGFFNEDKY